MRTVYATSMIYAQGFTPSTEDNAAMTASAEKYRAITGETGPTSIIMVVKHPASGEKLGYLTFQR
ncbi:MAG TPA: hypothetical protein VJ769_08015 [Actinomycetes bacterium]|nr:hypothetical protein [Actinomycetes bacterium]